MTTLETIKKPLTEDLKQYEAFMATTLTSSVPAVKDILDYIVSNRGKGVRPILAMLMAAVHSPSNLSLGKRTYLAALLVELIHTSSLVHDDVIDDSAMRHGKPSVNSKWGAKASVLAGDLILSKAFSIGMESAQYDLVNYVCGSITMLCEGELLQSDQNKKGEMDRDTYLDIIFNKTATLLGISCGVGALSVRASNQDIAIARQVGINLGMAFQIKDDILDYAPAEQTGKPSCADLLEKKITLPLLAVLENSTPERKAEILAMVRDIDNDESNIDKIRDIVVAGKGMEIANEVMNRYLEAARGMINLYDESAHRESLLALCDFIGERSK